MIHCFRAEGLIILQFDCKVSFAADEFLRLEVQRVAERSADPYNYN